MLREHQCKQCNERTWHTVTDQGLVCNVCKPRLWRGVSVPAASRRIVTVAASAVKGKQSPRCVKCYAEVNPGFCYTGKVLQRFSKVEAEARRYYPMAEEHIQREPEMVKVPITKYVRGFICDDCASSYETIEH